MDILLLLKNNNTLKRLFEKEREVFFKMWTKIKGYNCIGTNPLVCSGDVTIIGTRLTVEYIAKHGTDQLAKHGTIKEIMVDFNLSVEQVMESINYTYGHLKESK